jgi:hypothetical protein
VHRVAVRVDRVAGDLAALVILASATVLLPDRTRTGVAASRSAAPPDHCHAYVSDHVTYSTGQVYGPTPVIVYEPSGVEQCRPCRSPSVGSSGTT